MCGSPLDYLDQAEEMVCTFCGKQEQGHIKCPRGHFVCDACHNKDAVKIIADIALTTELTDPFAIADLMMDNPDLPMLGCQHAHIAGGALMAALKNRRPDKITGRQAGSRWVLRPDGRLRDHPGNRRLLCGAYRFPMREGPRTKAGDGSRNTGFTGYNRSHGAKLLQGLFVGGAFRCRCRSEGKLCDRTARPRGNPLFLQ